MTPGRRHLRLASRHGWSHNWFSYVHFVVPTQLSSTDGSIGHSLPGSKGPITFPTSWAFTNDYKRWQAILYATDDGEDYFNSADSGIEAKFGLTLIPAAGSAASGFKLIHPDGSVDEYSTITNQTFSLGIVQNEGRIYDTGVTGPRLITFGADAYYSSDGTYAKVSNAETPTQISKQVGYISLDALLTKRTDPYGNSINLIYNSGPNYLLTSIVDYDAKTTTLAYDSFGMLTNVSMPYGRSASFAYTDGQLIQITDAQGMSSSFTYQQFPFTGEQGDDTNIYLSAMTTPYGTTSFNHYEAPTMMTVTNPTYYTYSSDGTRSIAVSGTSKVYVGWYGGANRVNKACTITLPDNSHELYVYRYDSAGLVPGTYSSDQIPTSAIDTGVDLYGNDTGGINHLLSTRNSFHWNRQQYAALSTTTLTNLTAQDYKLATMQHWLETDWTQSIYPQRPEQNVSDQVSLIRAASPDGMQDGAITWLTHSGQWAWKSDGEVFIRH